MELTLFEKSADGSIAVTLPAPWSGVMTDLADGVLERLSAPTSVGGKRLLGPINPELDCDDPLRTWERESVLEKVAKDVRETAQNTTLNEDQAEAWLQLLGMATAMVAAELGIGSEEDLERFDGELGMPLAIMQLLQVCLITALDGEMTPSP